MHRGRHRHGAEDITGGERMLLGPWDRGWEEAKPEKSWWIMMVVNDD